MPIYEYRCQRGHTFEVMQSMSDDPISACPECGAAVERVFHPVAVHFKGSGFYTTDYGRGRSKAGAESTSSDGSKPEGKSESTQKSPAASESTKSGSGTSESSSSTKSSD